MKPGNLIFFPCTSLCLLTDAEWGNWLWLITKLRKSFHRFSLKKGSQHLAFVTCPHYGKSWEPCFILLFFSLDLTEARSLLKITSFPVVSNSVWIERLYFQHQFLVNTQLLDALVSQVRWGHLEPLASFTEEHGFLGSFCLEPFSTDSKGPLSSFEGCDHCQNPHKPSPWGMLLPAGPCPHQKWLDFSGSLCMELAEFPWMKGSLI